MAMGKRKRRQESLFITAESLPKSDGHPFYKQLNRLLAEADFDRWIERRCRQYYEQDEKRGRPSIPPGVYFRMLLVGYFEGIDIQRGIAWRCADSLSLRQFLGIPLEENTPDHSTLTTALGGAAVALATINVVGGFLVTDRMLAMFRTRRKRES